VHDHRSEPPLRELLTDYIDAGIVHYTWWNRSWDNWNYTQDENPQMVRRPTSDCQVSKVQASVAIDAAGHSARGQMRWHAPHECVLVPVQDVYNTCMRKYRDRHQFIAFLDSDEVRAGTCVCALHLSHVVPVPCIVSCTLQADLTYCKATSHKT
jgi:hypothetical protein